MTFFVSEKCSIYLEFTYKLHFNADSLLTIAAKDAKVQLSAAENLELLRKILFLPRIGLYKFRLYCYYCVL